MDTSSAKDLYDQFVVIYNQIDDYMRTQPGVDKNTEHSYLISELSATNHLIKRFEVELKACARLRNVLTHSPFMRLVHPMAMPTVKLVERYQEILNSLLHPPTALSIAVPASQIYTTTMGSNALEVMQAMNKNVYTHVPVLMGKKMVGVFSENTILSYLVHQKDSIVTSDLSVAEFSDFISLDSHPGEVFEFTHRGAQLSEVYMIFNKAIKVRRRVGVLFITEHGKPDEKLLGMLTAWDLAAPEQRL